MNVSNFSSVKMKAYKAARNVSEDSTIMMSTDKRTEKSDVKNAWTDGVMNMTPVLDMIQ